MIIGFVIYLSSHFACYVLAVRHRPLFRRELPIFLYHALPAAVVALVVLGATIADPSPDQRIEASLILAVQGIYSISFLELWALAQGGYSVNILIRLESARQSGTPPDLAGLEELGAAKKRDRLRGLRGLALVRPAPGGHRLTGAGRLVAGFLHAVQRVANVRESG